MGKNPITKNGNMDVFKVYGAALEMVSRFCYLGIHMFRREVSTESHLIDRIREAKLAFRSISKPWELCLTTAIALFELKISPIATYGIELIWENLTTAQLEKFDKLKANFLKRAPRVHRTSKNRLVYVVTMTPPMTEELQKRFRLKRTTAFEDLCTRWL